MTTMVLLCMRMDERKRVHPQQITGTCSKCGATVGIYPSGQRVLQGNPDNVVVCNHCQKPSGQLAPGAINEPFESVKKR